MSLTFLNQIGLLIVIFSIISLVVILSELGITHTIVEYIEIVSKMTVVIFILLEIANWGFYLLLN